MVHIFLKKKKVLRCTKTLKSCTQSLR